MPLSAPRDAAVIDIGSNSVRLVVYRLEGRAIWTVFNEKVLAGLGRDLATTGKLSPEGAADARIADARRIAMEEMEEEAKKLGANAVREQEQLELAALTASPTLEMRGLLR